MLCETVRLALISVRRNVLRSFLTLLGIVIGVAAVIAMITIGRGTTEKVKADISKLGSNLLVVRSGRPAQLRRASVRRRARSRTRTSRRCVQGLTGADAISAASQKQVRVVFGTESLTVAVTGTDTGYFDARDWKRRVGPRVHRIRKCATAPASACSARRCASNSSAPAIPKARPSASTR